MTFDLMHNTEKNSVKGQFCVHTSIYYLNFFPLYTSGMYVMYDICIYMCKYVNTPVYI